MFMRRPTFSVIPRRRQIICCVTLFMPRGVPQDVSRSALSMYTDVAHGKGTRTREWREFFRDPSVCPYIRPSVRLFHEVIGDFRMWLVIMVQRVREPWWFVRWPRAFLPSCSGANPIIGSAQHFFMIRILLTTTSCSLCQ